MVCASFHRERRTSTLIPTELFHRRLLFHQGRERARVSWLSKMLNQLTLRSDMNLMYHIMY